MRVMCVYERSVYVCAVCVCVYGACARVTDLCCVRVCVPVCLCLSWFFGGRGCGCVLSNGLQTPEGSVIQH